MSLQTLQSSQREAQRERERTKREAENTRSENARASRMNTYVLIFTVMTIIYLPISLTSVSHTTSRLLLYIYPECILVRTGLIICEQSVFGTQFWSDDNDLQSSRWRFAVVTVVLSLSTYGACGLMIMCSQSWFRMIFPNKKKVRTHATKRVDAVDLESIRIQQRNRSHMSDSEGE